jgi:hypothetical protein
MKPLLSLALTSLALSSHVLAGAPFESAGPGKPGANGVVPSLFAQGPATPGSTNTLVMEDAPPHTLCSLIIGFSGLGLPFKGGTLGPMPDIIVPGLLTDAEGAFQLPFDVDPVIPTGIQTWNQMWVMDSGAANGLSATNTLRMTIRPKLGTLAEHSVVDAPWKLLVHDLDGDEIPDLVVSSWVLDELSICMGNGDGTFGPAADLSPFSERPSCMTAADVNADGIPDLVLGSNYAFQHHVGLYLGLGDGSFGPPLIFEDALGNTSAIRIADLDGDGHQDLVTLIASSLQRGLYVARGLGGGAFTPSIHYPGTLGSDYRDLVLEDVDEDGHQDALVFTEADESSRVQVLLRRGDGLGGFDDEEIVTDVFEVWEVADVDADGRIDIVSLDPDGLEQQVDLGAGDGTFSQLTSWFYLNWIVAYRHLSIADMNADGHLDLIAFVEDFEWTSNSSLRIAFGSGDGTFGQDWHLFSEYSVGFETVPWINAMAVTDLNGDGTPDVVGLDTDYTSIFEFGPGLVSTFLFPDATPMAEAPATSLPSGATPVGVACADVDGDGILDQVIGGGGLRLLRGLGDGQYASAQQLTGGYVTGIVVDDFDKDGDLDLAGCSSVGSSGEAWVLIGEGAGAFAAPEAYSIGENPQDLAAADMDGDGFVDLVSANFADETVSVLRGLGDGTFAAQETHLVDLLPLDVEIVDLDKDGVRDLVIAAFGHSQLRYLRGLGGGAFAPLQYIPVGKVHYSVAIDDLNADGHLDLVTANYATDDVSILFGEGGGAFETARLLPASGNPQAVELGDLNADGVPDIVVVNADTDELEVWLGYGHGTGPGYGWDWFVEVTTLNVGAFPTAAAIADLDGDGRMDLVVPGYESETLSVFLQQP